MTQRPRSGRLRTAGLAAALCVAVALVEAAQEATPVRRAPVVADLIEATEVVTGKGALAHFSPSGDQFVIVTRKGNPETNTNDFTLLLFKTDDVFRSPVAKPLLTLSSASNTPAIGEVRWTDDRHVLFVGAQGNEPSCLYSLDVGSRKTRRTSNQAGSIVAFDRASRRSVLAFLARSSGQRLLSAAERAQGFVIANEHPADLLADRWQGPDKLFVQRLGTDQAPEIDVHGRLVPNVFVSPDGEHVVVQEEIAAVSQQWSVYKLPAGVPVRRYLLVEVGSGRVLPLLDAPTLPWEPGVAWSAGGESVIVPATFLPLSSDVDDRAAASGAFSVEVHLGTGTVTRIAQGASDLLQWNPSTQELLLRPRSDSGGDGGQPRAYRKRGSAWEPVPSEEQGAAVSAGSGRPRLVIAAEQDLSSPVRLIATDERTKRRAILADLNPQFKHLAFGKVEEITWTGTDGRGAKGGLYFPPDYVGGQRYPLVIQTHGWDSHKFWMDGPSTAGFAAQVLAGRGFVVAQADLDVTALGGPSEGPTAMASYQGLIDHLDERGLIDRSRVGLLGWSRTGYHVRYFLTFSQYPAAAAVIADGMDASYLQYLSWLTTSSDAGGTYERLNGSAPFVDGPERWGSNATGFNLRRVHTPVQLLALRHYSLLNNWEWFAGLRRLGKPVEMIWIPDAEHSPARPSERLTAQGGTVDWFCFWLQGVKDSDTSKAQQYQRWEDLRKMQLSEADR
jgi:dipeptidyl aminopeptidase/acylaminoacyl peptidase